MTQMLFQIKHTILELFVGVTVFYKSKCGGEGAACMIAVDSSLDERNKTDNVRITYHFRRFRESLLTWKSNKYYGCLCLCLCVGVRTCMCVCACVCVPRSVSLCMRVRACTPVYPSCKAYAPYCNVICFLWLHQNFWNYLVNGATFGEKSYWKKCVLWFSLQILSRTFLILRRI